MVEPVLTLAALFAPPKYLPILILHLCFVFFDWGDRDAMCWWTRIHLWLRGEMHSKRRTLDRPVMTSMVKSFYGVDDEHVSAYMREVFFLWLFIIIVISFVRLMRHHKIPIFVNWKTTILPIIVASGYVFGTYYITG